MPIVRTTRTMQEWAIRSPCTCGGLAVRGAAGATADAVVFQAVSAVSATTATAAATPAASAAVAVGL